MCLAALLCIVIIIIRFCLYLFVARLFALFVLVLMACLFFVFFLLVVLGVWSFYVCLGLIAIR